MRKYLEKLIAAKQKRAGELRAQIKDAITADEVRSLGETLQAVLDELKEAKEQLDALDDNGEDGNGDGGNGEGNAASRSAQPTGGAPVNPMREFRQVASYGARAVDLSDATNRPEYRQAFMDYVMRGTPIPMEMRTDANTLTSDVGSVIPTVVLDRIIERMDEVGTIINLVTRTSYQAGVEIPTSASKPTATWVGKADNGSGEGKGSDTQKKTTGKITFTYFKLRCEVSVSMEVAAMALSAFEAKLAENVANAMVKAIETAIISGTGTSEPKGILAETPEAGQALSVAKSGSLTYELLTSAEAALPVEYESTARWVMSKKTFYKFYAMSDGNSQPIARVNYGISAKPEYMLLGREVVITDKMASYVDAPDADTIVAAIFNFSDYMLNTIYDLGIQRKVDWDTEDNRTKAVMSVDGKVVDKGSLVTITKKSS